MGFSSWLRRVISTGCGRNRSSRNNTAPRIRPQLEELEDRTLLSATAQTLVVTNFTDDLDRKGNPVAGTLRAAIDRANKELNKVIVIDIPVGTIILKSSLPDLKNFVLINGKGAQSTIIKCDADAESNSPFRILTIDAHFGATMSGLTLSQGFASGSRGGAIDNFGTLALADCVLSGNRAGFGGAIMNEANATLSITGASFTNNSARQGGAIVNRGTQLTIQGDSTAYSTFSGNTAELEGGAVLNLTSATVTQTIFTDTLGANSAQSGGAINNVLGASLTINAGTSFSGNTASQEGGAIANHGIVTVNQGVFSSNTANSRGGAIENASGARLEMAPGVRFNHNGSNGGGAIDNSGTLNANDDTFTDNQASFWGGAIANNGDATLTGCAFAVNCSTGVGIDEGFDDGGGAIFNNATLKVLGNSTFDSNSANAFGGAIENFAITTLGQSTFSNSHGITLASRGGAISNWANLTLDAGVRFAGGSASLSGGAIYNSGTVDATDASFTDNVAPDGGAVANYRLATFSSCTFNTNHSTEVGNSFDGGGAIWNSGTLVVQSYSSFAGNTANDAGGAILDFTFGGAATVTVSQCDFTGNSAPGGGAIMNGVGTTLTINPATTFVGNKAPSGSGGAIYNAGTMTASGTTFASNAAFFAGGAFFNSGTATATGCTFNSNQADNGGAIFNFLGAVTLSSCQVVFNSAQLGGGLANRGGVLNILAGCQIKSNILDGVIGGGGIYTSDYDGTPGVTNIYDSFVDFNSPDDTYTRPGSSLTVVGSIIGVQT